MKRRAVLVAFGAGAFSPLASFAQAPGKVWRVGFLSHRHMDLIDSDYAYGPFTQGLRELGYVLGKNIVIEWRSAEGDSGRLPELAAELVRLKPDALVAVGTPASLAAKKATVTLPIVTINVGDPVGIGLVKSLARPGGNITGFSLMSAEIRPKQLEILREMMPKVSRMALMTNPANATNVLESKKIQAAAQKAGVKMQIVEAGTPQEIANGFAAMARQNAQALLLPREALFIQQREQILELAAKQRLPSISGYSEYAEAGGLMSYGPKLRENYKRAAIYVDKIFKGANPGELPVEQPTTFELVVNMKTAKALGIKVPQTILIQATRVIE